MVATIEAEQRKGDLTLDVTLINCGYELLWNYNPGHNILALFNNLA